MKLVDNLDDDGLCELIDEDIDYILKADDGDGD